MWQIENIDTEDGLIGTEMHILLSIIYDNWYVIKVCWYIEWILVLLCEFGL
jgi:hypothetical protein